MQKEVAQRICGKPATKDYNSLSVLIQYFTTAKTLFQVSPNSFYPEPGVESSVVLLERKQELIPSADNMAYFLKMNRIIFASRRKTLVNNIAHGFPYSKQSIGEALAKMGFMVNIRAENLTVEQIVTLANSFYRMF